MANGIAIKRPPEQILLKGNVPNVVEASRKVFDFPSGWDATNTHIINYKITSGNQVYVNDTRALILFEYNQIDMYLLQSGAAFQNQPLEILIEKFQ